MNLINKLKLQPLSWESLHGWTQDPLVDIWPGLHKFSKTSSKAQAQSVYRDIAQVNPEDPNEIRAYIEKYFQPYKIDHKQSQYGLFTGYFEPEIEASRVKTKKLSVPLYQRPKDLVLIEDAGIFYPDLAGVRLAGRVKDGNMRPYYSRQEIDSGALEGQDLEIAWVESPVDAFFMAIQGSGRLHFENGTSVCLTYDAANGWPYHSIGKWMIQKGYTEPSNTSMQSICQWLEHHPDQIDEILWQNPSYIFFREVPGGYQVGSSGLQLIPERSLAIDPAFFPYGTLMWLDIEDPQDLSDRWQRLMIAHDKGSAIKGPIRGDIYWGTGNHAGEIAGRMKSRGVYYVVLPRA